MSQRAFEREAERRERAEARRTTLRRRRAGLAAGAVGAAVLFAPSAANAATFQVNTVADSDGSNDCTAVCTLRDAITLADANPDADTITFTSAVTGAPDPTIYLANGQLSITNPVTITGPGADDLSISGKVSAAGASNSRIFNINGSGDARISGLTLTDGNGAANGATSEGNGGGIVTTGKLTLTDSVVSGNTATAPPPFFFASGGGIAVFGGQALVENSEITDNVLTGRSVSGAGIINSGGTLTVRSSSVTDNQANGDAVGFGGGITALTATNVESSHVDDNVAEGDFTSGGGGISGNDAKYPSTIIDLRAAAGPNQLVITDSTVSDNQADFGGGVSADFTTNKYLRAGDGVTIVRSTIDGNTATDAGGGLAVANQSDGDDVTVRETTVSNNNVRVEVQDPPARATHTESSGTGGGIDFGDESEGDALVSNSTVSGNSAANGGGIHVGSNASVGARTGRAAEAGASPEQSQPADSEPRIETNTTTTEEPPPPPATTGSLVVSNTTVAANDAADTGGGVSVDPTATDAATTKLSSTIVGDNTADGAANDLASSGDEGLDVGYSLLEQPGSATVTPVAGQPNITGQDPALGALTSNGGPTETHLPADASPAIDAGTANGLSTDQRGFARTQNRPPANVSDGTDIGAVEIPGQSAATPPPQRPVTPFTPSSTPTICGRRAISLVRADVKGKTVKLTGLVGSQFYGKTVTIQTNPKGARSSKFTKTGTVKASRTGSFSVSVPKPAKDDIASVRYRAVIGSAKSPALKLPQSLTSKSVKSAKGTITVKGKVKLSVLGKRNKVTIRRLVCGRYRTVGSAEPDAKGNYSITFRGTAIRGVAFYRAESKVLRKRGSKVYVIQYARAIAFRTTSQTG